MTTPQAPALPKTDSWWIGLSREQFQAEAMRRHPLMRQTLDTGKRPTVMMPQGWDSVYDT